MSKISELDPILGINTRPEDLFVIVNLIQGDDGTKNITRRELVQAIQYEEFDRITITGGSISGVNMFSSTLSGVLINDSVINRNTINDSTLNRSTIIDGTARNIDITSSTFDLGSITNSTANAVTITSSYFLDGNLARSSGNNMTFVDSTIDNSIISNSQFNDGTANNIAITGGTADSIVITNSEFNDGTGNNVILTNSQIDDSLFNNVNIEGGTANNLTITNLNLDEVEMTDVVISRGTIDSVDIANSNFVGGLSEVLIANATIIDSDFSNGTGNNNLFTSTTLDDSLITNSTIRDSVIANTTFQGGLTDVTITDSDQLRSKLDDSEFNNGTIDNSVITNSTFEGGIEKVELANSTIIDSTLVDFEIQLENKFDAGLMSDDSYFVLRNEKTGQTEQISYKQFVDEVSSSVEKALKVHVAVDGNDNNPGSILAPVKTLKRASEIAIEKAGGNPNRNALNDAVHISCGPGTYYVDDPIILPDDCAITSTSGQYATVIQKLPGYEKTNGILLGSGCYVQGFSFMNFEVDNFDYPEGGFAMAYRPGALMRRSPYLRDSTQLSNFNRLDVEPALNPFNSKGTVLDLGQEFYLEVGHSPQSQFEIDDEVTFSSGASGFISYIADIDSNRQIYVRNLKGNVEIGDQLYAQRGGTGTIESIGIDDFPNREVGRGGGCLLADRRVLDTDSLYTYVLCFGFTPRTQNGTGYVARDGAGVNGIGSLSIFTRQAFYALNGGQVTLNNSGSQFGDISMRAKGKTEIIKPAQADQSLLISNTAFANDISEAKQDIINDMVDYLTANTTSGGLGYQGYNADKCYRDTGIIVDNVGYDIATKGNYWGRLNGITYRSPISYVVVNEQMTETVGSIEHLRGEMNYIFENANTEVNNRVDTSVNETLNILQNGEEFANSIIFTDTGVGSQTGAREVVQDNREFILEEFLDWIDNNPNFFAYDSEKCKRDVREYILPAVKYDTLLDTNYNSNIAGQAYYFSQARNVVGAQRDETIAAYEQLRIATDDLVEANSAPFAAEAYEKFNEIIGYLKQNGKKFTPTNARYDAATGDFIITIGKGHGLEVGQYILLMPEGFKFTCEADGDTVVKVHPTASDPTYKNALPITAKSGISITVNVGDSGYLGDHTFVDALDNSVIVLGSQLEFSDDASLSADKRNARKQLQANKQYIQDYMEGWAENKWFFYDSNKCQRDTKDHIVPGVLRDMQLGTNYNSVYTGVGYRSPVGNRVVTDQLTETMGAIGELKRLITADTTDSLATDRIEEGFDTIIEIARGDSKKYTPTGALYNSNTGIMEVTIGSHDFTVGDSIYIEKEGLTFTCDLDSNATEHSYPTVEIFDYTPSTATYDPTTGIFTATIGAHNLKIGDTIKFKPEGIVFSCAQDDNATSHPVPESHHPFYNKECPIIDRTSTTITLNVGAVDLEEYENGGGAHTFVSAVTDAIKAYKYHPAYKTPITISATTATTITVNVGSSNSYTGVHTFVRAKANAIRDAEPYAGRFSVNTASYDPISGDMTVDIGAHQLTAGHWIKIDPESIVFSCNNNGVTSNDEPLPAPHHPAYNAPVRISEVANTTITVNVGNAKSYRGEHTFVSATADCIDTHAVFYTDAAKHEAYYTPTDVLYNGNTGVMEVTIGANHGLTTSDFIEFKPMSITLSCANTVANTTVEITHPRIGEPNYEVPLAITAVSNTTITVNPGVSHPGSQPQSFVRADEGAVIKSRVTRDGALARKQLQANKDFLAEQVYTYLTDNYFVYDEDKCRRDTGFILDAVRRDMVTGSNVNAVYTGKGYRTGTVGADNVINNQLTETVGAITWLKGEIDTNITSGEGQTRADAAFDEIIDIMQNGNAAADTIDFGDKSVSVEAFNARHALQANKQLIQEEVQEWIATNYPNFTYDIEACKRDLGIFIDLASWDIQHGSNAATVNNTRLYFENALSVLDDEEIVPTGASYDFTADLVGQIVRGEEVTLLSSNTAQVFIDEEEFTPSDATYDPVTGVMVLTIANTHTFVEGDRITIDPESIVFSCNTGGGGTDSHPNANDPHLRNPFIITGATDDTITVNAGVGGTTEPHTFVSAATDCVRKANMAEAYTPTTATYDHITGEMVVTLGDRHRFAEGDWVIFDENAITFSCPSNGGGNLAHPRPSDPIYNTPVQIESVTTTTITLMVGPANVNAVHTFVSATTNGLRRSIAPTTAYAASKLFADIGKTISENDGVVETVTEPAITSTGIPSAKYDSELIRQYQLINGQKPKYQEEIIDYIRETYAGLSYSIGKCKRDTKYIVDAVSEDMEYGGNSRTTHAANFYFEGAVNVLPIEQREPTKLAFSHLADAIENIVTGTQQLPFFGSSFTANNATYDPSTGVFTATIGSHNFAVGDHAWLEPGSFTFSCNTGSGDSNHAVPESHHFYYNKPVPITAVAPNVITMHVGTSAAYTHTFVSALADGLKEVTAFNPLPQNTSAAAASASAGTSAHDLTMIVANIVDDVYTINDLGGSLDDTQKFLTTDTKRGSSLKMPMANTAIAPIIEPSRTYARQTLQKNKPFIQEEVVRFIDKHYYTYSADKCARDVGFIIDAVARDVQTNGNYSSIYYGKAYRVGTALAQNVIDEQLAETIEAIKYVRDDILPRLSGTPLTNATAAFTNIIGIMKDGDAGYTYNYGTANQNVSSTRAQDGIQANKAFMQAEATAWLAVNYPSLTYDTAKCERDVGIMVDASTFDIRHGSNVAMRDVAKLYFENGVNVGLPADQRAPTAALFTHLGDVARQVVLKQPVTPSVGNAETQDTTSFTAAVGTQANQLEALWEIVAGIIEDDSLVNMPDPIEPNESGTGLLYDNETSKAVVLGRKTALSEGVNTYLQNNFDFLLYDRDKCKRDVGFMVDGISHDIQYGGNSAMWNNAQIYFVNAVNTLPKVQREPTRKAFTHMAEVMTKVVENIWIAPETGRAWTPSTATYDVDTGVFTATLGTGHNLEVGDYVLIDPNSIVFTCTIDNNTTEHPAPEAHHKFYGKPIKITAATTTTITMNVGGVAPGTNGGGVHTFVRANPNAIKKVIGNTHPQLMTTVGANRKIAEEVKSLGMMIADIADDVTPAGIPARIEPFTNWLPHVFKTEKDIVDDKLEAYVEAMINFISETYNGASYSKGKCKRDVGAIIDAVSHDVNYSTNYATRIAAQLYFDWGVSVLPFDQRKQSADFFAEMANLIEGVVQETATANAVYTDTAQDTSGTPATAVEGEEVADLVRIIEEAIRRNSTDAIPELDEPDTSWVEPSKIWAADAIDNAKDDLGDRVVEYLKENFTIIDYSKAKCRRDAGYIIDAMSWDLNYGGNLASRWNADFYYWNNELRIPENTRVATAQSYRQLGKIVSDVAVGEYPGQKLRPEMGSDAQQAQAYSLGMIFYNALFQNSPKGLGPTIEPNFAWETDKTFNFSKQILADNKIRLQKEVQRFITSEYKFIDLPKTYRDGGNFLELLIQDLKFVDPVTNPTFSYSGTGAGADKSSRAFAAALFNIDAKHVFPVFNPPSSFTDWRKLRFKGYVQNATARDALTGMKRWDSYIIPTNYATNRYAGDIYYWTGVAWANAGANNTDLLYSFYKAWERMREYINTNIAPDLQHRNAVTELIDNVVIESLLRPEFLAFGSLVESIAHQFNGASAGVNRNALPLNFRNVGSAISATASVLSEDGGRIRWSGSDELNNQYFARGLRINGRTGRIEGRPFTSSVRKLARRASNSRAVL